MGTFAIYVLISHALLSCNSEDKWDIQTVCAKLLVL